MMTRISFFLTLMIFTAAFAATSISAKPCATKTPKTSITKGACAKGDAGYEEAKKAWTAWVDEKKAAGKKVACKNCHEGTDYTKHKADAEKQYTDLGGQ